MALVVLDIDLTVRVIPHDELCSNDIPSWLINLKTIKISVNCRGWQLMTPQLFLGWKTGISSAGLIKEMSPFHRKSNAIVTNNWRFQYVDAEEDNSKKTILLVWFLKFSNPYELIIPHIETVLQV
jgi:hypothetical protein